MTRIRTVKGIAGFTTVAASAVAIAFLVGLVGLAAPVSSHHPAAPASTALLGAPAISFGTASKPSVTYELPTPNPQENGGYGGALAISGTVAVVGTSAESSSGFSNAGVAYIVNLATGKTIQLTSPDPQVNGYFGYSVAINGSTVAVGAPGQAVGDLSAAGEAYTFNAESGALILGFSSPLAATGGGFGHSVALSSKLFVVGAPGEGGSGEYMDSGHVYAFSTSTGDLELNLTSPNSQKVGGFGISVATTSTTLVVGAEGETAAGLLEAGHAYLLRASNGSVIATLTSPNPVSDGFFGISVAISGSRVIVGAPYETGMGSRTRATPTPSAPPRELSSRRLRARTPKREGSSATMWRSVVRPRWSGRSSRAGRASPMPVERTRSAQPPGP